ncbi:hypothetical protein PR202_ga10562 [Eleusine coracana subsp. coracana]|uniref:Uncharacterized protein n=1 Tax=Eleusine coracana subsp. coracana TaxID=191504 RepID=A0AAV5C708_ELECO|nr:hypothetical protein PR202_ga10562 [Eleusine coracana subsp. coracana]
MTTAEEEVASDELEPLFDYKRVQPAMTFRFDGTCRAAASVNSDLEKADIFKHCNKRAKVDAAEGDKADLKGGTGAEKAKVVDFEEEDWLALPPQLQKPVPRPSGSANDKEMEERSKGQTADPPSSEEELILGEQRTAVDGEFTT